MAASFGLTPAWIYLIIAGLLEICWAIGLKYSHGFTKPVASVFTIITLALSMFLLAKAAQTLPIGTAYAVWVGIGALGAAILGMVLFHEAVTPLRVVFLAMLVTAIIGLKATAA
ncbi:multidrug efflux SMR transporter [Asticcacaulis sp. AC402]|uniref:DMT family transporter n=1 Tax=Asticcacaulis sp. AC402 TaxID=1282361 RepID=UPI0003C3EED5|nr:SMR family transporter [Asticcacaulis sp. AC402]ESQ76246.1 membrane protein [Asticcacaulis sp. AC402]